MMWSFFSRDPSKDFPYEITEPVQGLENTSVWTLHKAKKKGTSEEVSVFVFDVRNGSDTQFDVAKAAVKRLKTLRHPSILTYLDSLESDKALYLATEYVEPLQNHLTVLSKEGQSRDLYLAWGIFQITCNTLTFTENFIKKRHWAHKLYLAGLEEEKRIEAEWKKQEKEDKEKIKTKRALSFLNNDGNLRHNSVCLSSVFVNAAGEWKLGGVEYVAGVNEGMGLPIKILPSLEKYDPPEKADPSKQRQITKCSTDMWGLGCLIWEAFNGPLPQQSALRDIENLDNFPENICRQKILPQLITAFEYGDAGSAVLMPMFKLGRLLDEADYQKKIVPCVVKLFASTDRATRIRLLQQLEHFIGHLQAATVNEQIFPQIAHGFMDTNSTVREHTVKSVIHLAPKLNYNNLNVEVLRHFARLQAKDDQGGIRTNTTVCLGKIAQHLHPQIRQKVLISAFIRAMRDPFPPARSAGVLALAATQQYFLLSEVATRILPALCQLTIDPEKSVRDSVFRTIKGFLGKLEKVSEDPSLRESMEADVNTATPSLSNAAATWAGWAVTAVTAKFYRSQSDTVKSSSMASKTLSKPGSLEQPSSSSISTTTSSVTSMTSLEQEESKGADSVSDYDENWDTDNWGEMEAQTGQSNVSEPRSPPPIIRAMDRKGTDGWDTEEWGSLEEEPVAQSYSNNSIQELGTGRVQMAEILRSGGAWRRNLFLKPHADSARQLPSHASHCPDMKCAASPVLVTKLVMLKGASLQILDGSLTLIKDIILLISPPPPPSNLSSPSEGWAATEFAPVENSSAKSISTYNWDEVEGKDEFPELSNRVQGISKSQSGWEDTEWEPLGDANGASNRLEEARKKREEKKLLRQKELEARRATRITGGPMKLGAKKV
uniref:N-terminal kinase-like protein n=1 Tax=Timema poppense TaxID=170557 RepID=A0A7R9CRS7_TIMPO|nr:unnamed protein product [Timema poppensis]